MSDDGLVRRLRRGQNQAEHAAADRIEELEAMLRHEQAALSDAVATINAFHHNVDELLNGSHTDEAVHNLRRILGEDPDHE